SPSVVPFSVTTVAMRPLFHMAAFVGEGVPNFEIRDAEKGTDLLVKTPYLGQALAKTLGGSPAALMRGHGSVTVGESRPRGVWRAHAVAPLRPQGSTARLRAARAALDLSPPRPAACRARAARSASQPPCPPEPSGAANRRGREGSPRVLQQRLPRAREPSANR